jgi:hypothetical protein
MTRGGRMGASLATGASWRTGVDFAGLARKSEALKDRSDHRPCGAVWPSSRPHHNHRGAAVKRHANHRSAAAKPHPRRHADRRIDAELGIDIVLADLLLARRRTISRSSRPRVLRSRMVGDRQRRARELVQAGVGFPSAPGLMSPLRAPMSFL